MAYHCFRCNGPQVTNSGDYCGPCMAAVKASKCPTCQQTIRATTPGPLKTRRGPPPDPGKVANELLRQLYEDLRRLGAPLWATTPTGALVDPGYQEANAAQRVKISTAIERAMDAKRKWEAEQKATASQASPDEEMEACIRRLVSKDTPDDRKQDAIKRITASLGAKHLQSVP